MGAPSPPSLREKRGGGSREVFREKSPGLPVTSGVWSGMDLERLEWVAPSSAPLCGWQVLHPTQ